MTTTLLIVGGTCLLVGALLLALLVGAAEMIGRPRWTPTCYRPWPERRDSKGDA